jgi:hypothetical protein
MLPLGNIFQATAALAGLTFQSLNILRILVDGVCFVA